jgi:mono/diheme cytochrome c family protein
MVSMSFAIVLRVIAAAAVTAYICASVRAQDQTGGGEIYADHCATCHGERMMDPGAAPDLRELRAADRPRFETTVMEGRGQMPAWRGVLDDTQVNALWAYVRSRAFER